MSYEERLLQAFLRIVTYAVIVFGGLIVLVALLMTAA